MTTELTDPAPLETGPILHAGVVKFPPEDDYSGITIYISPWEDQSDDEGVITTVALSSTEVAQRAAAAWAVLKADVGARGRHEDAPAATQGAQRANPRSSGGLPQQGTQRRTQGGGGGKRRGPPPKPEAAPNWYCDNCHQQAVRKRQSGSMPGDAIECGGDCKNPNNAKYPLHIAWVQPGTDAELPPREG